METCTGTSASGERCKVFVGLDPQTGLCLWHDPKRKAEALAMRQRGAETTNAARGAGPKTVAPEDAPPMPQTIEECAAYASWLANAVLTGVIDARTCKEAVGAIKQLQSSLEKGRLEQEVAELKKELERLRRPRALA